MSEAANRRQATFVSAEEVARLAGVSRSAVSRAFTPGASISVETRQRVEAAAAQLGYHVNHLARGLMRHESGIVCLVVADIHTPYLSRLLDYLSRALQEAGKAVMVLNAGRATKNVEAALRQTLNYRADATIVLSGTPYRSIARQCLESGQRLILINRDDHFEQTVGISVDHAKAAQTAAMLIRRGGYRRPALVSSGIGTPSLNARRDHFLEALRMADLTAQVWEGGPTAYQSGFQAGTELMTLPEPPDAVFAVTDLLACGVMDAVRQRFNKRVPDDIGVIGFDDIDQASWSSYDLTTFSQPVEAITAYTVRMVEQKSAEIQASSRTFEAPLIWRSSLRATLP
ncbi:substrate-binding domain-containing protein [Mesorhizobium sp. RP14(2022)]|uniref:Substrate-binding domain-containing protein n=1 Tax=Mesorhizobium liriopis TaxID=2953882 RepID=A0ABT1C611_9HYPH|nr:substrate-binding domain-containing protein [Mesorhizobium liriopis]MCO6050244.1 substrate-binding domain-containing protein [Mesorhizobium liriopis]